MCVFTHMCMCVVYVCAHVYICVLMYVCLSVCMLYIHIMYYTHTKCVYVSVRVLVCMCMCVFICMCVCICVCVYVNLTVCCMCVCVCACVVLASTDDGLLEGRRTCDPVSVTGLFPSNCVEYVQMRRRCHNQIPPPPSASPLLSSLPPSASPLLSSLPPSTSPPQTPPVADLCVASTVRTVTLSRDRRGFGFVLRGAKAGSPLLQLSTTAQCPALQYLDQVDAGDAAHRAGLRKCDFVLAVSFTWWNVFGNKRFLQLINYVIFHVFFRSCVVELCLSMQ